MSSPLTENLSKPQRRFLEALTARVEARGLCVAPEASPVESIETRYRRVRRSQGMLIFGCAQWEAERLHRKQEKGVLLTTEFAHIQASMAVAAKRPLLVLREKDLADRGVLRHGHLPHVVRMPRSLNPKWLEEREFETVFERWMEEVECFRHVFLGYSSNAEEVGKKLYQFLTETLKLRVFDWHEFRAGDTIWESIERAERSSACGVFLFMADDQLTNDARHKFAPRDNVVYEAGYFAGAKGRKDSLVIREEGAKVPSDLGGLLYLTLNSRKDIGELERPLREYVEYMLNRPDRDE